MSVPKNPAAGELGDRSRDVVDAFLRLLELTAPEDARRLRRIIEAGAGAYRKMPQGCFDAVKKGDVAGALLELAHEHRRKRGVE